jgi:hypothetical protein
MTLAAQITSDLSPIFFNTDDFAVTVSYTPSGGGAQSIKALLDYGDPAAMQGMDALNTDAIMDIMASDIPTVTAGDTVTIGSDSWQVIYAKLIDDGLVWRCYISRRTR